MARETSQGAVSGQDIRTRIGRELDAMAATASHTIFVQASDDGRVRLEGVVHSLADHTSALATARSTPGVRVVEDLLKILL
ncbi:MAG: hypothetical protein JWR63_2993 [Conexibacter sp.]|nr:hypothetical protein [Conexibacter sp.]